MKKIIVTFTFTAAVAFSVITDAKAQQGMQLGVEGTPQLTWLLNKDDLDNSNFENVSALNCSFGISGQYGFNETMGIGLNVLYSYQGQQFKLNGVERIKKLEYLKIPLMYVYNYEITPDLLLIGKIGPQLDVLMKARLTDKDGDNIISDQSSAYEDFDIAGVAMVGLGYKLSDNFLLDGAVRFDYGFTNAENEDYKGNINNPFASNGIDHTGTNRAMTYNMTAGVTIGVRYLFAMK